MKGLGTDEDTIISVVTVRSNKQRQMIAQFFQNELERVSDYSSYVLFENYVFYFKDLVEDLKSELGGHFEDVILALVTPPEEYLCKQLHRAMEGMGTEEDTLIEIICSRSNSEVETLVETYERSKR